MSTSLYHDFISGGPSTIEDCGHLLPQIFESDERAALSINTNSLRVSLVLEGTDSSTNITSLLESRSIELGKSLRHQCNMDLPPDPSAQARFRGSCRRASSSNSRRPPIRQPLSCVPCRRSKIKCNREDPCNSCRRRYCTSSCTYDSRSARHPTTGGVAAVASATVDGPANLMQTSSGRDPSIQYNEQQFSACTPDHDSGVVTTHSTSPLCADVPSVSSTGRSVATDNTESSFFRRFRWDAALEAVEGRENLSLHMKADGTTTTSIGFPFDTGGSMNTLVALLPPKQHCDYLISCYFDMFGPLFHILHEPTFRAQYLEFSHQQQRHAGSWLALLFVILSLAVTCLEEFDPILSDLGRQMNAHANIQSLSTRFRETTMRCLASDNFLSTHDMSTLQALVLLVYAMNHSSQSEQSWTLLGKLFAIAVMTTGASLTSPGIALNIGIALGYHVDGQRLDIPPLETELRRRCWAGLKMLYAIQASTFGLIDMGRLADDRVKLPLDVDDVDIHPDYVDIKSNKPTEMTYDATFVPPFSRVTITDDCVCRYMLYKFRLHQLSSTVCKHVAGPSISEADDVLSIDQRIRFEELKWDERYRLDSRSKTLQLRDQAHWNILHCYANQLRLLLYRPLLHVGRRSPTFNSETVEKCASSSIAILGSYRMFCESPLFRRYSWFANGLCSFFALHAASTLAACLLQRGQFSGMDQARDIFNRTTLLFRDRKDRSAICEKSLPVLLILQCVLKFDACLHYGMHTDQTPRTKGARSHLQY